MKQPEQIKQLSLAKLRLSSVLIIFLFLTFAIISAIICFKPLRAEYHFRNAYMNGVYVFSNPKRFSSRFQFVREEYQKAIDLFPWETHYRVNLAKDLERFARIVKDPQQIEAIYREIIDHYDVIQTFDPYNPWYFSRKAIAQATLAKQIRNKDVEQSNSLLRKSIQNTKKAAQIDYENPIFLSNYANILYQNGRLNEPIYYYEKSLSIDPSLPAPYFQLGNLYSSLGEYDQALKSFLSLRQIVIKRLASKNTATIQSVTRYQTINSYILNCFIMMEDYAASQPLISELSNDLFNDNEFNNIAGFLTYQTKKYEKSYQFLHEYYFQKKGQNTANLAIYLELMLKLEKQTNIKNQLAQLLTLDLSEEQKSKIRAIQKNSQQ